MYQALYRKWRPRTFDDVVGQSHITDTLKRQIAAGRPSHAYLFTGTRGTGKTTCAKILSRAVNCHNPVDGNPCNACPACLGIESGAILDVLELDAASNNGVDQVRALRDEAVYTPAAVRKRVYIVDEVHMLSPSAFNALLKIMEEPPEHLMFILATTELHKVPATVKSRCQQFSFKRILPGDIASRLTHVAGQEGIDLTDSAAALLARLADGGMRDALSLLDQCAAAGATVDDARVLDTLGLAGNLDTAKLMEHIADGDTAAALELLGRLYAAGKDVGAILGELSCLTRDLLLRRTAPQGAAGLLTGGFDETTLRTLGERFSAPRLMQMLTLLQQTAGDLPRSTSRRTDAELCLIRLCDVTLDESLSGLSARLTRLEEMMTSGGVPAPAPTPASKAAAKPATPAPVGDLPPWEEAASEPKPAPVPAPAPAPAQPPKPAPTPAPSGESGGAFWDSFVAGLRGQISMAAYPYLSNRAQVRGTWKDGVLTVWVPDDFTKTILNKPAVTEVMAKAANARFGGSVRVAFAVGTPPAEAVNAPSPAPAQDAPDALDALLDFGKFDNITIN
ncbi:MAG: DNA polymerase III subunit gamma/tau [Oscillospiraceae bacterium]|nr:DNA polymerase III subunit gamma/tau [Oscillospiraceae bacterium]